MRLLKYKFIKKQLYSGGDYDMIFELTYKKTLFGFPYKVKRMVSIPWYEDLKMYSDSWENQIIKSMEEIKIVQFNLKAKKVNLSEENLKMIDSVYKENLKSSHLKIAVYRIINAALGLIALSLFYFIPSKFEDVFFVLAFVLFIALNVIQFFLQIRLYYLKYGRD